MSLEAVGAALARAAVFLDFDGSLAPIVQRPEDAQPLPEAQRVLRELAGRTGALVVVTGRPASFVTERLDVPGLEIAGLYGLDGVRHLPADVCTAVEAAAAAVPGARLEDKGATLAVHIRGVPDPAAALAALRPELAELAASHGLRLMEGKLVLELAPAGRGKGDVVREVVARTSAAAALYAGDDLADLDAFEALDELRASGLVVCKVAVGASEAPLELLDEADLIVDGPRGLLSLLGSL